MIKKVLTGAFVALTFIIYSIHQRGQGGVPLAQLNSNTPTAANNGATSTAGQTGSSATTAPASSSPGKYKDGSYTGNAADAFYGYIQVKITVSNGNISDVAFLQYPNDRGYSIQVNSYAMPILKQQAIAAQSAQVDGVSGATDSSQAFVQSLSSAIAQAQA